MAEHNAGFGGVAPAPMPSSPMGSTSCGVGELGVILRELEMEGEKDEKADKLPRRDEKNAAGSAAENSTDVPGPSLDDVPLVVTDELPIAEVIAESSQPPAELTQDVKSDSREPSTHQSSEPTEETKLATPASRTLGSDNSGDVPPAYQAEQSTSKVPQAHQTSTETNPQQLATHLPAPVPPTHQYPAMGQQGWEKSPDRPPQKLPIRFKDCVGRHFLFPWKKAKTWKGVQALINSAFLHVDVIGPHVLSGHYDLFAHRVWATSDSGAVNPELTSFQHMPQVVPPTPTTPTVPASSLSAPPTSPPPGPTTPGGPPPLLQGLSNNSAIILPELWNDIIEPGMMISMHMWPMSPPIEPMQPHIAPAAMGRGAFAPPPPNWNAPGHGAPPPPPGWMRRQGMMPIHVDEPLPRAKTRKKQDAL